MLAVLVGGLLSYWIAHVFSQREERRKQIAAAHRLLFKIQRTTNDLVVYQRQIRQSMDEAGKAGIKGPVWTQILEFSGVENRHFSPDGDELSVLLVKQGHALVNEICEIMDGHDAVTQSLCRLFTMKNDLGRELRPTMAGSVALIEVPTSDVGHLGPTFVMLDTLGNSIVAALDTLVTQAKEVAAAYGLFIRKNYKISSFPILVFPDQ